MAQYEKIKCTLEGAPQVVEVNGVVKTKLPCYLVSNQVGNTYKQRYITDQVYLEVVTDSISQAIELMEQKADEKVQELYPNT